MSFSLTHLWLSPGRLVLLFINDNEGKREQETWESGHARDVLVLSGLPLGPRSSVFVFSPFGLCPFSQDFKNCLTHALAHVCISPQLQKGKGIRLLVFTGVLLCTQKVIICVIID